MNQMAASENVNLTRVLQELRLRTPWILGASALAGAIAYVLSSQQPNSFQSCSTLLVSASTAYNSPVYNPSLLPQGAINEALASNTVVNTVIKRIGALNEISQTEKEDLTQTLRNAQASDNMGLIYDLRGRLDIQSNGTYVLCASHGNPAIARQLADITTRALVDWDYERGRANIRVPLENAVARVNEISALLQSNAGNRTALFAEQALLNQKVSELRATERSIRPTLSVIREAVTPNDPVGPKPLRTLALASLLTLLAVTSFFSLKAVLDRSVSAAIDLKALSLRLLGELPRIGQRKNALSVLGDLRQGLAGESVSFLRTNLNTLLARESNKIILVTSSLPGEGKSNVCAVVADAFAAAGQKTLIVDADLRRPSQSAIWAVLSEASEWINLPGAAPFPGEEKQDLQSALTNPEAAQVRKLRHNLHFLPAGQPTTRAAELFSSPAFSTSLKRWASGYDVILIDSPPVLAVTDPLVLAPLSSGVLLVLEAGRATQTGVQRVMDSLMLNNGRILGAVLNKVSHVLHRETYQAYTPVKYVQGKETVEVDYNYDKKR